MKNSTSRNSTDQETTSHTDNQNTSFCHQLDDQYTIVSSKKKPSRDYNRKQPSQHDKFIVDQLIQISGLMAQIKDNKILTNTHYFGKYGPIASSVVYQHELERKKRMNYMAYIKYENYLDAAIALVAMQNYTHRSYRYSCRYGTTKYCQYFLRSNSCKNKICHFLHKDIQNAISVQRGSVTAYSSLLQAKKKIVDNLSYFVEKENKESFQIKKGIGLTGKVKCECPWIPKNQWHKDIEFPSVSSTLSLMLQKGQIQEQAYLIIKNSYKPKNIIKSSPTIIQPKLQIKQLIQSSDYFPSVEIYEPQIKQTPIAKVPKVKQKDNDLPYIVKRYFYPHIKNQDLSPQTKVYQKYCQQREKEITAKKFYRPRKLSINRISLRSQKAFDDFLHFKITGRLKDKIKVKSFFNFANPMMNESIWRDNSKTQFISLINE